MKISVVMPVYNEGFNELRESINSVLNQTIHNFEFIIVDDNPKSIPLKRFLCNVKSHDRRIKLLFNSINLGLTPSVNKGIRNSNGHFIARMDADDICVKNRLENQLNFIRKYNLDLICSNYKGFTIYGKDNEPYYGRKSIVKQKNIKDILSRSNIAIGPTFFFRKVVFNKLHGYRKLACDDYDFITRSLIYGYSCGYQANVLLYKRNRINNISNNNALNEFICNYIISKNVKKNNYNKVLPLSTFINSSNLINKKDINAFKSFKLNFNNFKEEKSIKSLIQAILNTLSSYLVLKRNLWILFINRRNRNRA